MTVFDQNRALLDAFRRGEKIALASVYRFYIDAVLTMIRLGFVLGSARFSGEKDPDQQLDTAHSIFVKAFSEKARMSYDGLRPYRPFLMRIGRNLIVDRARKSGREVPTENVDGAEMLPDEVDPERELHWKRLREATEAFLAEQSDEMKTFVRLRFEEELSQYEVIEKMKITRRRVRTLEKQAQTGLKKHLQKAGLSF